MTKEVFEKIVEVARQAQAHIDNKKSIKGVSHSMRYQWNSSYQKAWQLGYRGSMEDWQGFMRKHGGIGTVCR